MSDLPVVSVEMKRVLDGAREAGDSTLEGKALTALAEVALLREGDLTKATELVDAALEVLPAEGRFGALEVRGLIAWWTGDFETQERTVSESLEIARRLERKDLEAHALDQLASVHRHLGRLDEAKETLVRGLELAEESGSIVARARALHSLGALRLERRETDLGEQELEEAKSLFAEVGDAWMLGRTLSSLAWAAELRDDDAKAEGRLRESIKLLKTLGDRGALCESQRGLAEVLIRLGRLDEAERLALEAVETVGEHDLSSRATTTMTLGLVRAAQGKDAESEELLLEALGLVEDTGFRGVHSWVLRRLEDFLRERDRDAEADVYAGRRAELAPAAVLGDAFARRMERIA
jgi:tetratricopeptide (TPR) repeat protein